MRFIVTKEMGKLAKWLRILGYDSVYYDKSDTPGLIIRALREERILLTRSDGLTKYKGIKLVVIKHDHVEDQLDQTVEELGFQVEEKHVFTRCIECNAPLNGISKAKIEGKVPEYVLKTQEIFKICPECNKIFWKGTHWDMVKGWLEGRERGKG